MSFLDKIKDAFSSDKKREEIKEDTNEKIEDVKEEVKETVGAEEIILAPITGEVKDIKECVDPVFAQEIVGKGVVIVPSEGKVFAPVDGKISMLQKQDTL